MLWLHCVVILRGRKVGVLKNLGPPPVEMAAWLTPKKTLSHLLSRYIGCFYTRSLVGRSKLMHSAEAEVVYHTFWPTPLYSVFPPIGGRL